MIRSLPWTLVLLSVLACNPRPTWKSVASTQAVPGVEGRSWSHVARGLEHACAVDSAGAVMCWGNNQHGQIGDGTRELAADPTPVLGLTAPAQSVVAGGFHSCALLEGGGVSCWGLGEYGQLGPTEPFSATRATWVPGLEAPAIALAAGLVHTCALLEGGAVACWGLGADGQLGSDVPSSASPLQVEDLEADMLAAGAYHTCARSTGTGEVMCWGAGYAGQLGDGRGVNSASPVAVRDLGRDVVELALGDAHSCARMSSGLVACWGADSSGQLGDGLFEDAWSAIQVEVLEGPAVAISAGGRETCALQRGGALTCWGQRFQTEHFIEDETREFGAFPDVVQLSTSGSGTCVRRDAGEISCWGLQGRGVVLEEAAFVDLDVGYEHVCALGVSGRVWCWGANAQGQLGSKLEEDASERPVVVPGLEDAVSVVTGGAHTCVLSAGGRVHCWGYGADGQLGSGERKSSWRRHTLDDIGVVAQISAGDAHTCALLQSGSVACWGWNRSGQLGDGSSEDRLRPVPVEGVANARFITSGYEHSCALDADGKAWCWGYNVAGELGDGSTTSSARPVAVQHDEPFDRIAAGDSHTCALDALGRAWCWGKDTLGQLGNGDAQSQTRPMRIEGVFGATHISAGSGHTCASGGGQAWCWGLDDLGQLGDPSLHPDDRRARPLTLNAEGDAIEVIHPTPRPLTGQHRVSHIEAGHKKTCMLLGHQQIVCSGAP